MSDSVAPQQSLQEPANASAPAPDVKAPHHDHGNKKAPSSAKHVNGNALVASKANAVASTNNPDAPATADLIAEIKTDLGKVEQKLNDALGASVKDTQAISKHYSTVAVDATKLLAIATAKLQLLERQDSQKLNVTFKADLARLAEAIDDIDSVFQRKSLASTPELRQLLTAEDNLRSVFGLKHITSRTIGRDGDAKTIAGHAIEQVRGDAVGQTENEDWPNKIGVALKRYFDGMEEGVDVTMAALAQPKKSPPSSVLDLCVTMALNYLSAGFYSSASAVLSQLGGIAGTVGKTILSKTQAFASNPPSEANLSDNYDVKAEFSRLLKAGGRTSRSHFESEFNKFAFAGIDPAVLKSVVAHIESADLVAAGKRTLIVAATSQWINLRNQNSDDAPTASPLTLQTTYPTLGSAHSLSTAHITGSVEMEVLLDPDCPSKFLGITDVRLVGIEPGIAKLLKELPVSAKLSELQCAKVFRIGHVASHAKKLAAIQHVDGHLELNYASSDDRAMIAAAVQKKTYAHGGLGYVNDRSTTEVSDSDIYQQVARFVAQASSHFSTASIKV